MTATQDTVAAPSPAPVSVPAPRPGPRPAPDALVLRFPPDYYVG